MALITKEEYQILTNSSLTGLPSNYAGAVLETVSDHLQNWCSRLFAQTEITDEMSEGYVTRHGWLTVHTKYAPVVAVTALKYQYGATTGEIDLSNAEIDYELGRIRVLWYRPLWGGPDRWTVLLSYQVGDSSIPMPIKMAVALLVREAVEADEQAVKEGLAYPLQAYSIGSYSETYAVARMSADGDLGLGTELSLRARALALPYRRAGIV